MFSDPFVGAGFEEVQRQRAAVQDFVVEGADIELRSQLLLGMVAEFANLELPEFLAERLSGPGDVAVGLGLDRGLVDGTGLAHEFDDLIATPALGVNAGVDNQAHGAE